MTRTTLLALMILGASQALALLARWGLPASRWAATVWARHGHLWAERQGRPCHRCAAGRCPFLGWAAQ